MELLIQAFVTGIVQGLTEFLPVSSSAHLIAVPRILGWDNEFINSAAFDVMLHIGTLVALIAYFWRDLVRLLGAFFASLRDRRIGADPDRRLAWLLAISVVPAAVLGVALESFFDTYFRERLVLVAVFLAVGALLLWGAERLARHQRDLRDLRVPDALAIGGAQALALFPGISRSGISIAAGLALGLQREAAARFAFLMGTPVIAGAGLWKLRGLLAEGGVGGNTGPLLVGMVAAAVAGLIAISVLLAYLRRRSTAVFIAYRLVAAALLAAYVLTR